MVKDLKKTGTIFCIFSVAFIISLPASILIALRWHSILGFLGSFLFFWPQLVILPFGIYNTEIGDSITYLNHGQSVVLASIFWILVGLVYAWLTRRLRLRYQIFIIYPVIVLIAVIASLLLELVGYSAYIDGP